MSLHNFKYSFKTLMRVKPLVFWTFAFPLILGTFFYMAFSNIEKSEIFSAIDIAVVDNESFQMDVIMKESLSVLGDKDGDNHLFNIKYVSEEKARELLDDKKVDGYLISSGEGHKVVISKNGINQTIFKSAVEEIIQQTDIYEKTIINGMTNGISEQLMANMTNEISTDSEFFTELFEEAVEKMGAAQEVKLKDVSGEKLSYIVIEFYTLIAMTCLYGGIIGMAAINQNLANMSKIGRRTAISPTRKGSVVLSSLLASYIVQLIGILLLFLYVLLVLKIDFGSNLLLIIVLTLDGCLAGLTMGIAAGVLIKAGEGAKIGVILAITMLGCFLSGMMGPQIKYYIDKSAPLVNKFNPAAMITDGFYSLYYYETLDRYCFNLISLLIFSAVMVILSQRGLRRQQYDSI